MFTGSKLNKQMFYPKDGDVADKYYVVLNGTQGNGIYSTSKDALDKVSGKSNASCKKFKFWADIKNFIIEKDIGKDVVFKFCGLNVTAYDIIMAGVAKSLIKRVESNRLLSKKHERRKPDESDSDDSDGNSDDERMNDIIDLNKDEDSEDYSSDDPVPGYRKSDLIDSVRGLKARVTFLEKNNRELKEKFTSLLDKSNTNFIRIKNELERLNKKLAKKS